MKHGKFNARGCRVDGHWFDSQAEAARYAELRLAEHIGQIRDLRIHPKYAILPQFVAASGERVRTIWYEADFSYIENEKAVVEDVKGVRTALFKLKRALFLQRFPEYEFWEVSA